MAFKEKEKHQTLAEIDLLAGVWLVFRLEPEQNEQAMSLILLIDTFEVRRTIELVGYEHLSSLMMAIMGIDLALSSDFDGKVVG